MGGKPSIRGMRVTVGMIVEAISAGRTIAELLSDFPYLEEQDIREALAYAASLPQDAKFVWPVCAYSSVHGGRQAKRHSAAWRTAHP